MTESSTVTYCYPNRWIPGRGEERGRMGRPWTIFWPFVCILLSPMCINSLLLREWDRPVCEALPDAAAPPFVCVQPGQRTAAGAHGVERWGKGARWELAQNTKWLKVQRHKKLDLQPTAEVRREVARVQLLGYCTELEFSSIFNRLEYFFWLLFILQPFFYDSFNHLNSFDYWGGATQWSMLCIVLPFFTSTILFHSFNILSYDHLIPCFVVFLLKFRKYRL